MARKTMGKLGRADYESGGWTDIKSFGQRDVIICYTLLQKNSSLAAELFDDVVPSARELMDDTCETKSKFPLMCTYLLYAYLLLCHRKGCHVVSIADWIQFWSKLPSRYSVPPPRKECKTRRSASTHNPTGVLPRISPWVDKDVETFTRLNIPDNLREGTYLAAFLSCWLCCIVLPVRSVGNIRAEVFKMTCFMAKRDRVSLAVTVLSSIYRGLNAIAGSKTPSNAMAFFPVHYVYEPLSKLDRDCVEAVWQNLSQELDGKPLRDILSMKGAVDRVLQQMKAFSRSSLSTLEETLKSFFQSARSSYDAHL
ncbi:hypothetical protein LIER_42995 [Lithospermum erythrorhizon]|uniref:Aminotransferase-like plant mobile domain-containing protein n=1 Tax=Lithospermum erythrorhizon TaxID=34254 RepID=A0AAV3PE75_LITER